MFVFKAAVVGGGTLGAGIAETIEAAGIPVVVTAAGGDYGGLGDVDLVIETGPEELEARQELYAELDEATPGRAILASGTPSLPIAELADATIRPDKVVGLHFFTGSRVVEVVEGEFTSPETVQAAVAFAQRIRRTPICCLDAPGFVINRILLSAGSEEAAERFSLKTLVEACLVVEDGVATMREVDLAMAAFPGVGAPPFRGADEAGLNRVLARLERAAADWGEEFEPAVLVRRLVAQGRVGPASGQGFYPYPRPDPGWEAAASWRWAVTCGSRRSRRASASRRSASGSSRDSAEPSGFRGWSGPRRRSR